MVERETMEFDVVIVGAGPAGLSCAIRLAQQAQEKQKELMICVVEKGSEVGAHILSGAVFETKALDELIPDWAEKGAPITTKVTGDDIYLFKDEHSATKLPHLLVPKTFKNEGNYIVSMGNVCRWLAEQAEQLGIEIFPGFSAHSLIIEDKQVKGIVTGDMGLDRKGQPKDSYMPGMELRAKYTIFAEGCRGHLGKSLISEFELDKEASPQHYGIGFKEIWQVDPSKHKEGLVVHGTGWPLDNSTHGGSFMYHGENNQVVVGLIIDLNYSNPHLSPFDEFQRMKHHDTFAQVLEGAERVAYGARAIAKGGFHSLPKMHFPGGLLIGCDAGTLNFAKIKGNHTAMKSGMLAADAIIDALEQEHAPSDLASFADLFKASWLYDELYQSRNFGPAMHKLGRIMGGAYNMIDQNIFSGSLPFTIKDEHADHEQLKLASKSKKINYPKPDGKLSFDKLSSVFLSNTNHEEVQPCHLQLKDSDIPIKVNLAKFDEPAQRYCPAGVYEVNENEQGEKQFVINSQNCIHCKTCDIKDPSQNITWVTPEGAGGPNYPNM
ncbi:electron transfer flavoprotein-ubiquinone oxidoreductase [Pseudoalteromonas sp. McH1-7]|uniref:Electron transfer flavoprotein-ubiquinone oxidoreductase n=1 Tax=Pseudoalteromonas peptidolytica F12-50-A1 TaxID=1315280 RepID=A0A8I0MW33_9GAMM|nr:MULTISPECIES: electron transfer flavoprotein-ubiquinone oxidoreductase [Pseudoalteromonas]MBE0346452.1 electron-transferring-flavoprotein dehydrogenase [Pseudoalteromonas peptidolytica F12-50-A1]NLR14606.1 electron transfer flavoprotein-ubiquinone oxidoreductase [Pseudoalteromonas peptidolytica]NUZ09202.1 electron transfer flavoprotein-ubiquinone oxidoreductase [Pseudoalteromonas sp. McH1-7]USD29988.1 electron transfer flavoprotein-ubiquinone oxidoreductase [Pseudoalteromonas sp. SCSIO 43201